MAQDAASLKRMEKDAYRIVEDTKGDLENYVDKAYLDVEKMEGILNRTFKSVETVFDELVDANEHQLAKDLDHERGIIGEYLLELRAIKALFERSFDFE